MELSKKIGFKISIFFILICPVFALYSQVPVDVSIFAGPNITNVILRGNSLPSTVGVFTNPRPYNSVNYSFGVQLDKQFGEKWDGSLTLQYERIRSSSNKFNDNYRPGIDANLLYIGTVAAISIKPLSGSNIKMDIGGFFYYALNGRFGFDERGFFISRRVSWGPSTSIIFPVTKRISFRSRFLFGLRNLRRNEFANFSPVVRTERPYSLQLTLGYKILKRDNY